jgi:hypothetical protein
MTEHRVLNDPGLYPSDEVIFLHIGKSKKLWISFFDELRTRHPDITPEWRYYNDGKSWLLKATRKKKTIFWLSVIEGAFRITSYFTDKAEGVIKSSTISGPLKEQFLNGKHYGKLRGLTVTFRNPKDLVDAESLIAVKLSIK